MSDEDPKPIGAMTSPYTRAEAEDYAAALNHTETSYQIEPDRLFATVAALEAAEAQQREMVVAVAQLREAGLALMHPSLKKWVLDGGRMAGPIGEFINFLNALKHFKGS